MRPLFAILTPYTPDRQRLLDRVMEQLDKQRRGHECMVILSKDNKENSTGAKRNQLLDSAKEYNASHIAFVDSDDLVGPNYVQRNMEATIGDYDTAELWGQYYEHGKQLNPFHHSIKYDKWWQDDKYYYRCNNHLNCMKLEKVKDFKFLDRNFGEDGNWAMDIQKAGVLKREYPVKEILYYYFHGLRNHALEPMMALKRGTAI